MTDAVRFEDVGKTYPRGGARYASLRHDLARLGRYLFKRERVSRDLSGTRALDGLDLEISEGESFGIVGPNGAGKTTILKLIAGITYPTEGSITLRGRVGSLIEVGAGIHPELTGRENIWLFGQIAGASRNKIQNSFEEIVDFSELNDVLDTPVKFYSSGMQMRLGFSIASHLDPDIFAIDEVLAVGDAPFQAKCLRKVNDLVREGRTLIFVSHDLEAVETVCERAALLIDGRVKAVGPAKEVIGDYIDWIDSFQAASSFELPQSSHVRVERVSFVNPESGQGGNAFETGDDLEIRMLMEISRPIDKGFPEFLIADIAGRDLAYLSMALDGHTFSAQAGRVELRCKLRSLPLVPRAYSLWFCIRSETAYGSILDWCEVGTFRVVAPRGVQQLRGRMLAGGPVHIEHSWDTGGPSAATESKEARPPIS